MLSACSNFGGNSEKFETNYVKTNLIMGKTTKEQVLTHFGNPDEKDLNSDGSETWLYRKDSGFNVLGAVSEYIPGGNAAASANDAKNKENEKGTFNRLWIYFNKNGIVTSWMM